MIGFLILGLISLSVCVVGIIRLFTTPRARALERLAEIEAYGSSANPAFLTGSLGVEDARGGLSELATHVGGLFVHRFGRVRESDLRAELMAAGMYGVSPGTLLGYRILAAILFLDSNDVVNFGIRFFLLYLVASALDSLPFIGPYLTGMFTAVVGFLAPVVLTLLVVYFVKKYFFTK